jgi:hypothetical protein
MKERIVVLFGMDPEVTGIVHHLKFQLIMSEAGSNLLQVWTCNCLFVTSADS